MIVGKKTKKKIASKQEGERPISLKNLTDDQSAEKMKKN